MSVSLAPDRGADLAELADEVNREHALVLQSGRAMVEHAILAGEALLSARELTATGDWLAWVDAQFSGSRTIAHNYMRLAIHQEEAREEASVRRALTRIAGQPGLVPGGRPVYSEDLREEVRVARGEGASLPALSKEYGISTDTVRKWVDPEYRETRRRQQSLQHKRKREEANRAREQRERQQLKRTARERGGAIAETYSLVCKLEDELGRAYREAKQPAAKGALQGATEAFHRMRDEVVRALGAS